MKFTDRCAAAVNKIAVFFTVSILIVLCVITFLQVIYRYVLNDPLSWSEEVVRYLLVWITFLGITLAVYKRTEMSVSFFTQLVPAKVNRFIDIVMTVIILAFLVLFTMEGFDFAFESMMILTIALQIPYTWINLAAPVGGVFMILLYSLRLIAAVGKYRSPVEPAGAIQGCPPEEAEK
jgi:TRAP-type C4-dicarboxylate transport system permease small subunit